MDKFFLKDSIILNSNMQVFNQWVFPALTYGDLDAEKQVNKM